jgi:DNA-binding MarR family transcriptional regulator
VTWGNIGTEGIRLTDLAAAAQLSLAACSELVDELQGLGYLERQPDPSDGRAKLIFPTAKGREVLDAAGKAVADLEQRWRERLPPGTFDRACHTFNDLIGAFANEGKLSEKLSNKSAVDRWFMGADVDARLSPG